MRGRGAPFVGYNINNNNNNNNYNNKLPYAYFYCYCGSMAILPVAHAATVCGLVFFCGTFVRSFGARVGDGGGEIAIWRFFRTCRLPFIAAIFTSNEITVY